MLENSKKRALTERKFYSARSSFSPFYKELKILLFYPIYFMIF